jgi:hypothetical protein
MLARLVDGLIAGAPALVFALGVAGTQPHPAAVFRQDMTGVLDRRDQMLARYVGARPARVRRAARLARLRTPHAG